MSTTYSMILEDVQQTGQEDCFIGGKPKLPAGSAVPKCGLCGAEQTFYFQIAFPYDHIWAGLTLAVFACTNCADGDFLIPEMLPGILPGANIPQEYLLRYQRNFRFEVFQTTEGQIVKDYNERIRFRRICLGRCNGSNIGQVGGMPTWILDDESPDVYNSTTRMCFLLQVGRGAKFEIIENSPPQRELGLSGDPEPSPFDFYQLFLGNEIYFFGTDSSALHLVYALTQVK